MQSLVEIKNDLMAVAQRVTDIAERIGVEHVGPSSEIIVPASGTGLMPVGSPRAVPLHFIISSLFLREHCYPYLMKSEVESLAYITGVRRDGMVVLDHLVTFDMDVQEVCLAKGNLNSSTTALMRLSDLGYEMHALIHRHPGQGAYCTLPSSIDRRTHGQLEAGGYTAIGIIMTADGYVRFFSNILPFTVEVLGKDVVPVRKNSYRLLLRYPPKEDPVVAGADDGADDGKQ